jgi:L-glyceraldehyde 3-phosphate reductase
MDTREGRPSPGYGKTFFLFPFASLRLGVRFLHLMTSIPQRFLSPTAAQLPSAYIASTTRYDQMAFRRAGRSGLLLPAISLGLWQNFGDADPIANSRAVLRRSFDLGVTHFDLANNYGPPQGAAERTFGQIFGADFKTYRDEMVISTKAGYDMWPGPYGEWGSRKYLIASLDQSLQRMGLDYVDVFYSHRPDPETPLEETMGALDHIVRSGRALYVGISNYSPEQTRDASRILRTLGTPCLLHQPRYNMFDRHIEEGLLDVLKEEGIGCIVFSPLAQGLLTERYLEGVPADSRAGKAGRFLKPENVNQEIVERARKLAGLARQRGQSLAQLAVTWILRQSQITSVLIGASRPAQVEELQAGLAYPQLTESELQEIENFLR